MKRIWISVVAVALLSIAALAPAAAQDTITIDMNEVDDSGQSGSADITSDGDQTIISVSIDPGEEGVPQPAHIHDGSCAELGGVAYPLEDVVDGESETTVDVTITELIQGEYAINVHLSEDEMGVNVACGTLPLIAAPDDDDAVEEDDDAVEEDDDAVEEDDEVVEEDDEVVEEEDDAVVDDDEADDAEEMVPAAGSTGGLGPEAMVLMMTLAGSAALGTGLLVRRRFAQA